MPQLMRLSWRREWICHILTGLLMGFFEKLHVVCHNSFISVGSRLKLVHTEELYIPWEAYKPLLKNILLPVMSRIRRCWRQASGISELPYSKGGGSLKGSGKQGDSSQTHPILSSLSLTSNLQGNLYLQEEVVGAVTARYRSWGDRVSAEVLLSWL